MPAPRLDLYTEVTGRIVAELEAGRYPWVQPWGDTAAGGLAPGLPRNAATGRTYSGVNVLILWGEVISRAYPSQSWLTFRQALDAGGTVRKGEKGATVVYADRFIPEAEKERASATGDDPKAVPHTHIMLRGRDDQGKDLLIARDYIAHGLRERAAELVQLDLGPRTDLEIEERLRHDVTAERLTVLDRRLVRDMDIDRVVLAADADPLQQGLRAGRLQTLQRLGLADDLGGGRWCLAEDIEETLKRVGERGDIIRTMQRELSARNLERPGVDQRVYDPADGQARQLVGKLLHRGLADELHDRHYLLVDGIDGEVHYVPIGRGDSVNPIPENSIVRIVPTKVEIREADRTIDAVARANGGIYSIDAHLRHDPNASETFAATHVRRLEAQRRRGDVAERLPDGNWRIADDHLARVEAHERRVAVDKPVEIETVSTISVDRLPRLHAATWIDRRLTEGYSELARDAGFGRELREAEVRRRQWLVEQDLAVERDGQLRIASNALDQLRRRELLRVAGRLSEELGRDFQETRPGERIEGVLQRPVEMVSGRHALIERGHDFTLVPWRPALERQLGKPVSGIIREAGISWSFGRERGGPTIS